MVANGIGKTRDVEPANRHALAKMGRSEKLFYEPGNGSPGLVLHESLHFPGLRWQTNQVKVKPAHERAAISSRRCFESQFAQTLAGQQINRITVGWRHGLDRRHVGPVLLVLGPSTNPTSQQFFLSGGKDLVRLRRRHHLRLVKTKDAGDQFALLWFARNDGAFGNRIFPDIQAELSFARVLVRAMAMKAIVGEDRPDISIVTDPIRSRAPKRQEKPETPAAHGEKVLQLFHAKNSA